MWSEPARGCVNRDVVIGIAGAAILVVAMVGVFVFEHDNAQANTTGGASPAATAGPTVTGSVAVGKNDVKIANVTATNATNVTFHLTWKATQGKDTLKLTVAPPTGSNITAGAVSEAKDTGDITVSVAVPTGANPAGGWKVQVDFVKADATPVGGVITPPTPAGGTDASVSYTVAITLV